jgi:hypothetical protein
MATDVPQISEKQKYYFSKEDWTTPISLMRLANSDFWRRGFWAGEATHRRKKLVRRLPVGQIKASIGCSDASAFEAKITGSIYCWLDLVANDPSAILAAPGSSALEVGFTPYQRACLSR